MKHLTWIIVLFVVLGSCTDNENTIPYVPITFTAPLNDPRLSRLNSSGGAVVIDGYGVAGLVIYRRPDNVYVAYDRCSTVNPEKKCSVTLDDPTLTVTDPCTGAKFSLFDGSPVKAPGKKPLQSYQVTISGFALSVSN